VREGFDPDEPQPNNPEGVHNLNYPFTTEEGEDEDETGKLDPPVSQEASHWESRNYTNENEGDGKQDKSPQYGSFRDERDAWSGS
jgi:hypothetical protein